MKIPSNELGCQELFLQAAGEERGRILFGGQWEKTCGLLLPFVESVPFPSLYLEFPLAGEPFLDVTVLYGQMEPGTRFRSEAAAGTERMIDWYAGAARAYKDMNVGFELDAEAGASGLAAVHFQHRSHLHLAQAFCEALGEPEAGRLYLNLAAHMPEEWSPAFFGMFRGRAPLRCASAAICMKKSVGAARGILLIWKQYSGRSGSPHTTDR